MHDIVDLTFKFEFGKIDDRSMTVSLVSSATTLIASVNCPEVTLSNIKLPNQIKLKFAGKNSKIDTRIDNLGNIVQDMYTKIVEIKIDRLKVPIWVIEKKLSYLTEQGKTLTTSYIGFNGEMTFDILETNTFSFYNRLIRDN